MSIPVAWPYASKGICWDHGLLLDLFDGKLWPLPISFEHHNVDAGLGGLDGAVVVATGTYLKNKSPLFLPREWCLFVHTSDEELAYDSSFVRYGPGADTRRLWLQMRNPTKLRPCDRGIPFGWRRDIPGLVTDACSYVNPHDGARVHFYRHHRGLWSFVGQINHPGREDFWRAIENRADGMALRTAGFTRGLDPRTYIETMLEFPIALCPGGRNTPETFRLYEALEAGLLPICDRRGPGWPDGFDYWRYVTGEDAGFPCVDDSWEEVHAYLEMYKALPIALLQDTNKAGAWWIGQKRAMARNLINDLRLIGCEEALGAREPVTILIPTSPIASHPSTAVIEECVGRLRAYPELANAEIIVMVDGVRPEQRERRQTYEEYKRNLIWLCRTDRRFFGVYPLIFSEFTHQAGMMTKALQLVRTPLVMYVEHDTWPIGEIDFRRVLANVEELEINCVRFHIFDRILPEHEHLYGGGRTIADGGGNHHYIRTTQWSQRPHVAKTQWYRRIMREFFRQGDRTMIEDVMHGKVGDMPAYDWGLYVYAPNEGTMLRSATCDARGADPKYQMILEER